MPLSAFQQRAAELVLSDREGLIAMAKHAKRIDPTLKIPELEQEEIFNQRVEQATKPLLERLEEVTKKLEVKDQVDSRNNQWALLKSAPYNWNEKQIQELEERMAKDAKEGKVMFGQYDEAAKYYTRMDSPLTPSNPNIGISRHDKRQDTWRKEISDPKSPFSRGNRSSDRKAKKERAAELWNEARAELGK